MNQRLQMRREDAKKRLDRRDVSAIQQMMAELAAWALSLFKSCSRELGTLLAVTLLVSGAPMAHPVVAAPWCSNVVFLESLSPYCIQTADYHQVRNQSDLSS